MRVAVVLATTVVVVAISSPLVSAAAGDANMPAAQQGATDAAPATTLDPLALAEEQLAATDARDFREELVKLSRDTGPFLPELGWDTVAGVLRGEGLPWEPGDLLRGLAGLLAREVRTGVRLMAQLVLLTALFAVLDNLRGAFSGATTGGLARAVAYLALAGVALGAYFPAVDLARTTVDRLASIMLAAMPLVTSLLAGTGSLAAAGLLHPLVVTTVEAVTLGIDSFVLPLLVLAAVVSVVSGFTSSYSLSGLAGLLRQIALTGLGVMLVAFLFVTAIEGAAAGVGDSFGLRTAKFMAKSFVPVVGSMFADTAELVVTSGVMVRNAVGLVGLAAVMTALALPAMKLILLVFTFRAAAAVLQPIDVHGLSACLDGLASSVILLAVSVGAVAVMFLVLLATVLGAGNLAVAMR